MSLRKPPAAMKVSIVIPAHNEEAYLREIFQAACAQAFGEFE